MRYADDFLSYEKLLALAAMRLLAALTLIEARESDDDDADDDGQEH